MLRCIEEVVHDYIIKEMSGHLPKEKTHDLFAVEGVTAAMCYIFDTLGANHLLNKGDHIALMVPIFTPYLEIPHLSRYKFKVTHIHASKVNENNRQVALKHTTGLSTPQQVQMAIFSIFALLDKEDSYKNQTKEICHRRLKLLYKNLDLPIYMQDHSTAYYREIDLLVWAKLKYKEDFVRYLTKNYAPEDLLFRLAKDYAIVLLNGNGFEGPDWSIRVSLANLPDEAYVEIGKYINEIFNQYVEAWKASK